jgi:hypothetical protein
MTETVVSDTPDRNAPRRRRLWPWVALAALIAAFATGVALAPRIERALPFRTEDAPAPVLEAPVARVPVPEASVPETSAPETPEPEATAAPTPDRPEAMAERLDRLEQDLALPFDQAPTVVPEDIETLRRQIVELSAEMAHQRDRLAALEQAADATRPMAALALARLRQAVAQGAPYAAALEGVRRVPVAHEAPDAALATLAAHAATGVASAAALRDAFDARIAAIIEAESVPEDVPWWRRALARLQGAVTVRPTGEVAGESTPAVVARIEAALARGELEAALREAETLPPRAAAVAAEWLERARARQAALAAVDALETAVTAEGGRTP